MTRSDLRALRDAAAHDVASWLAQMTDGDNSLMREMLASRLAQYLTADADYCEHLGLPDLAAKQRARLAKLQSTNQ